MAKVITTIVAEGVEFDEIVSFKTKNYIGVWDYAYNHYTLIESVGMEFSPHSLPVCSSLKELDDLVYEYCNEHIEEVFEFCSYEFKLSSD